MPDTQLIYPSEIAYLRNRAIQVVEGNDTHGWFCDGTLVRSYSTGKTICDCGSENIAKFITAFNPGQAITLLDSLVSFISQDCCSFTPAGRNVHVHTIIPSHRRFP